MTLFELGDALDREGRYDEAWAAWAEGNRQMRLQRAPQPYFAAMEERLAFVRSLFTREWVAYRESQGHRSRAPVFVLGLPRTGSTLVEQILIAHRDVTSIGETSAFTNATQGRFPYPIGGPHHPRHFEHLGELYLAEARRFGWRGAPRLVDKHPSHHQAIAMLHLMFPRSAIIHTVRHPLDVGLSNFRRHYAADYPWAYDLADIARAFRLHRAFMDHWAAVLPAGRIVTVENERLIEDPETQMRRLLKAAGLPWSDRVLRFHQARDRAKGGSFDQVREPLNSRGVGRWRHYARHLAPLAEALGPYAALQP